MNARWAQGRKSAILLAVVTTVAIVVILVAWFGRASWGGWWIADRSYSADTYLVATIFDRWAAQVHGGHLPLWFPEFAGGFPVHSGWMYGFAYPPVAAFLVLPLEVAWTWLAIVHAAFGAAGIYAYLRDERRDAAAAVSGAVVFAFSGFMLGRIGCGHLNLVMPFAWVPWVLLATRRTIRGDPGSAAWLGICGGLGLLSGHVQVWFYAAPVAAASAFVDLRRAASLRPALARLAAGGALALGISAIQWIPAAELFLLSGREIESHAVVGLSSVPASVLAAEIAPRFAVSDEPFRHEMTGLAGPLSVAATLLAFRPRDGRRWLWFGVLAFGLVLAMGTRNEVSRLANELPPFRWGRAPGRSLLLVVIAGSVLSAHTVADWCGAWRNRWRCLVPVAFAASALLFGVPPPDSVRKDFFEFDWTSALPDAARGHRVYVMSTRYPYLERFGARTLRDVCSLDTPGYRALQRERPAGSAWWFDIGSEVRLPWDDGPPADRAATIAAAKDSDFRTLDAVGSDRLFTEVAPALSDDRIADRLRAGDHHLWVDVPDAALAASAAPLPQVTRMPGEPPSRIEYRIGAGRPARLFTGEKWYPGWKCRANDGEWTDVARANLAFTAVRTEPGSLVLEHRPWWLVPALVTSGASAAAALALVAARAVRDRSARRAGPGAG
jgi:hypothetical protein